MEYTLDSGAAIELAPDTAFRSLKICWTQIYRKQVRRTTTTYEEWGGPIPCKVAKYMLDSTSTVVTQEGSGPPTCSDALSIPPTTYDDWGPGAERLRKKAKELADEWRGLLEKDGVPVTYLGLVVPKREWKDV